MTARRLALGVLSLVAGAEAAPWTYAPINCALAEFSSLACCTDAAVDCCSWSGDTDGAPLVRIGGSCPDFSGWLYLNNKGITLITPGAFDDCGAQVLILEDNLLTSIAGVEFPPSLRTLYLSGNLLTSVANVEFPPSLRGLFLNGNQLSSVANVEFPPSLQDLFLNDNQLSSVANVEFPPSLERLYLINNQLSSIACVEFPPSMTKLVLKSNQLTGMVNVTLPESLEDLQLQYNALSSLAGVKFPATLEYLDVTNNDDLTCLPLSPEVIDGMGYGYDYNGDGDFEDAAYGYEDPDGGYYYYNKDGEEVGGYYYEYWYSYAHYDAVLCEACSADDTTCEACTPAPGQCVVTPKCESTPKGSTSSTPLPSTSTEPISTSSTPLPSTSPEPISTPRPPWICACQEKMWREHWDPAHIPTFVHVTVALDYAVGDFNKDRQGRMTSVIAHVASVEEEGWRVTISSVADGDASGSIAVGVRVRVPPFEAVPVADRADSIRGKLTLELINAQVALEPDSLKAITAVLEAASIHSGETA